MKNNSAKALVTLVALLLAAGALLLTVFPAARYSATENRLLADTPTFSLQAFSDGSYTASWDTYATERLPLRDRMRKGRALLHLSLGEREVGEVILCRDGSLSRRIAVEERAYLQNLNALKRLRERWQEKRIESTVAILPRRIEARAEVLPSLYREDMTDVWQKLAAAQPDALSLADCNADAYWYRTDHHWTTHGAYFAYCRLAERWGFTPLTDFRQEVVSTQFFGTSDAAASIPFVPPDTITLYRFSGDGDFSVRRDGKAADFTGLYDHDKLHTRDQYAVFLGGNCAQLTVDLGGRDTRPTLLLVRDSFADALIPFLARHFRIVAIDPRYRAGGLDELLADCDRILILCGMQSICNATFFTPLLR